MRQMKRWLLILLAALVTHGAWADMVGYSGTDPFSASNGVLTAHYAYREVELLDSGGKVLFHAPSPDLTYLWISPDSEYLVGLSSVKLNNPCQLVVWRRDGTLLHSEHISASVARLSPEQRRDFAKKFPEAEHLLQQRYFTYNGATYLDFATLGLPHGISGDALKYLFPLLVQHPYSSDFSESVTNWVYWFDEKNPDPKIITSDGKPVLQLRSPSGRQMEIPLTR